MSFIDSFKNLIGIEDEYDDYYGEDYGDRSENLEQIEDKDEIKEDEKLVSKRTNLSAYTSAASSSENIQINIHEPVDYEDSPKILDSIIDHRAVVLNLEMLEMEAKKEVFNFVSGGIYALRGRIEKVTKDIFIIAPEDVEIDGKLKERIEDKGFYQY